MNNAIIPHEIIENRIYLIRGQKVMVDFDLAKLYQVTTKRLNEQVKRNLKRFPSDFMFRLTKEEFIVLRSQIATFNYGRKYLPYVFTELGIAMLSSVLNSERAIQVNIAIMRTFARLRQILSTHKDLRQKLEEMEKKYDGQFKIVFDAIHKLMNPPIKTIKRIGFYKE